MAQMSGFQFLGDREDGSTLTYQSLSSAVSSSDLLAQVTRLGAASFLSRPFTVRPLQDAIHNALHRSCSV
jgi:FixJ family two-component response regulator